MLIFQTPDMQHMHLLQQLMLNPALMMQLQQAQAQQQQQQPQVTNPLQMLQHGMAAQSANQAEMMRRIYPESAMRPQHQ